MNLCYRIKKLLFSIKGKRLCMMCGECEATEKIKEPNAEQDDPFNAPLIDVCWECGRYIEWAKGDMIRRIMAQFGTEHNLHTRADLKPKPFDIWLLDKYHVLPKIETTTVILQKKG
ncbi:unnamed protein product [marine sediment metagenome]|uniref:Uncharacterized protein n=1 Tax=marine sediment metagenome TaxID=412755 RepID=X1DH36_9ZZZZ